MRIVSTFAALALAAVLSPALAQAPSGKVTVLTSFSKDVTDPFKKAFEAAHPGMTVEVLNRNTNAAVKQLEETRSANQVDIMWASAPDAFEVLKDKKLLQAYKPKATGIPAKVGAYPINDPDGYYSGFAASGYGIMWNERYAKANKLPDPKEWQDLAEAIYFDQVSIAPRSDPARRTSPSRRSSKAKAGKRAGALSRNGAAIFAPSRSARSAFPMQ